MHPPNVVLRSMAPLGAWLFPAVTIDGSIHSRALSRLPEVCAAIEADPLMHRKISFGTGNVVLAMGRLLDETAEPEIPTPCLFIHGTADSITDCAATEAFFDRLKCPRKTLHLHQGGYHKRKTVGAKWLDVMTGPCSSRRSWLRAGLWRNRLLD